MISLQKILLKIKKRLSDIRFSQRFFDITVSAVIILLAVFLVVQLSSNVSVSVSTLRTQNITDTESLNLKGYIFRDESIYYAGGAVADFSIDNGQRVGAGKQIANLYGVPSGADRDDLQSQLKSLSSKIRLLERGIEDSKTLSQSSEIFDDIENSYYAYLKAIKNGSYSLADKESESFLDALNSYMVATGRTEEAKSVVNSLKAEKESFISSNLSGTSQALSVEQSCYFYTECDGYENLFDYDSVLELTPSQLASLSSAQRENYSGAIGKQVFSPTWYICFPASDAECDLFVGNASENVTEYEASFLSNNGVILTLKYERAVYSDGNGNSGFVTFSCKQSPDGFEFLRAQNVRIDMSQTSGYRVPTEAVFSDGQKNYVYVLNGNTVETRRITVIGKGNGYYIVNTYEADYEENGEGDVPYLSINELIIISGKDLYDGKLFK